MGFSVQPVNGHEFTSLDDLSSYVESEDSRVSRIPVSELLDRGARFFDDHSFGTEGAGFQFNEEGLRSLCALLGVPFTIVGEVEKPGLATDLLNDLLGRYEIEDNLRGHQFVVDHDTSNVLGIVTETYRTYTNRQFLLDMQGFLKNSNLGDEDIHFRTAYVVNTRLRLRVLSKLKHGRVTGVGGDSQDESVVGFQVANSMVGDTAVSVQFFIERLLCANGMVAPVSHTENRVFHSGKEENFAKRLEAKILLVLDGAARTVDMLTHLSDLLFDSRDLAKAGLAGDILDVIPEARPILKAAAKGMRFSKEVPANERKLCREEKMLDAVPKQLAVGHSASVFGSSWRDNASMFDFVNVFTEKAKELPIPRRIESEERAGALADCIAKNKSKFRLLTNEKQNRKS